MIRTDGLPSKGLHDHCKRVYAANFSAMPDSTTDVSAVKAIHKVIHDNREVDNTQDIRHQG